MQYVSVIHVNGAGLPLIKKGDSILTYCNAGILATGGIGTALAPLYLAKRKRVPFHVYVPETRPLLQGARLTAWELKMAGIPHTLICDGMIGTLMSEGKIRKVITGADRIARNGDTANKIGTYSAAVLARHHKVPFYVAAPFSTFAWIQSPIAFRLSAMSVRFRLTTSANWQSSARVTSDAAIFRHRMADVRSRAIPNPTKGISTMAGTSRYRANTRLNMAMTKM